MERIEQLKELRKEFPPNQISKLPKPTKQQTEEVKADFKKGKRCQICGSWHHPDVVHLDYVGHAALTDRLLDTDPAWTWEPLALDDGGLPRLDGSGGLWIKLTVCGVTRLGYGDAGEKKGGDAMKERIGDALRNAAMRFGAALDLWHKGTLHPPEDDDPNKGGMSERAVLDWLAAIESADSIVTLKKITADSYAAAQVSNDKPAAEQFQAAAKKRREAITRAETISQA